jgi:hypothetical protein
MNVATLILQLQEKAKPNDEVFLIVEDAYDPVETKRGIFTGKVIGTGTGAKTGQCEIFGLA